MLKKVSLWQTLLRGKSGKPSNPSTGKVFPANELLQTDDLLYSGVKYEDASHGKNDKKIENIELEEAKEQDSVKQKSLEEKEETSCLKSSFDEQPRKDSINSDNDSDFLMTRKHGNTVINNSNSSNPSPPKTFSSLAPHSGEILEQLRKVKEFSRGLNLSSNIPEENEKEKPPVPLTALEQHFVAPSLPPIAADIELAKLTQKPQPFESVPGPTLLRLVNNVWKMIPILVSQIVATSLFTVQNLVNTYGKEGTRNIFLPYNRLAKRYGTVVRLHRPLGGDIVLLSINGDNSPLIKQPSSSKASSIFDSLTEYRLNTYIPPDIRLNIEEARKSVMKVDFSIDPFLPQMEEVANLFVKRAAVLRDYLQEVNETFNQELLKWSLVNTWMVYTRRRLSFFDDDAAVELKIESEKFLKQLNSLIDAIRISETGIQLWRIMNTMTWATLVESARSLDRFLRRATEEAITELNEGGSDKESHLSLVQSLLLSGELKTNDYLTQLLDVIVLNSIMGAHAAGIVMYYLAKEPVAQKKVLDEIKRKITDDTNLKSSNLEELSYLKACILESIRLKPAIPWLARVLKDDSTVQGYKIPKGTLIQMVNKVGSGISGKHTFMPDRWVRSSEMSGDSLIGLPSWSLSPSVNRTIVIQQVMVLCIKMLQEYHIAHHQDQLTMDGMVLSAPTSPYSLKLIERHVMNNEERQKKGIFQ